MVREMKHTEIGDIPVDWELQTFEETFRVLSNNTLSRENLNNRGGAVRNIHYGDILTKFPEVLDCREEDIPYINDLSLLTSSTQLLQDGDVVIADTAEDDTVGKVTEVQNIGNGKLVAGLHTIPCRVKKGDFAPGWLGYYLNSNLFHNQILPFVTGIKVSSISKSTIAETMILIPPREEQEKIVESLQDSEFLIKKLKKLVLKKQEIKNTLLHQLMTGERRIDGFVGDWERIKLKMMFSDFIVPMGDKPKSLTGNIPWCRIEDFNGKYLVKSKSGQGVNKITIEEMNLKIFPVGTLLVSCSANLGRCAIVGKELITNQTFIGLVPNSKADVEFFYYRMCFEEKVLNAMATGTTITYLSREQFEEYELLIPTNKKEQHAIAQLLSDFDGEIEKEKSKLQKHKLLKEGMMNDLLTGKVRLV